MGSCDRSSFDRRRRRQAPASQLDKSPLSAGNVARGSLGIFSSRFFAFRSALPAAQTGFSFLRDRCDRRGRGLSAPYGRSCGNAVQ